jgi:hypothetical protein
MGGRLGSLRQIRAAAFAFNIAIDDLKIRDADLKLLDQHPNFIQSGAISTEDRSESSND